MNQKYMIMILTAIILLVIIIVLIVSKKTTKNTIDENFRIRGGRGGFSGRSFGGSPRSFGRGLGGRGGFAGRGRGLGPGRGLGIRGGCRGRWCQRPWYKTYWSSWPGWYDGWYGWNWLPYQYTFLPDDLDEIIDACMVKLGEAKCKAAFIDNDTSILSNAEKEWLISFMRKYVV